MDPVAVELEIPLPIGLQYHFTNFSPYLCKFKSQQCARCNHFLQSSNCRPRKCGKNKTKKKKMLLFLPLAGRRRKRAAGWKKLGLLMWKSVLLRKRHWILTAFEIILPTLLFILLLTIRTIPNSSFVPVYINEVGLCFF